MKHYEHNLRHIVRPDKPTERETSPRVGMADYAALYLARALEEFAAYEADTDVRRSIAWGLAEYIERCIYEERKQYVTVYAHTSDAREVLVDALDAATPETDMHHSLHNDMIALYNDPKRASDGDYE